MRLSLRAQATLACLACAASSASAAEPTLEQLLAEPSPSEIAANWKAVCLEHAGDTTAQRDAVEQLKIDWPYQAMFDEAGGKPACMMVSSTGLDVTGQALGDAVIQASQPLELRDVGRRNRRFSATMMIDGSLFRVQASITPSQGVATAVVALIDMKEKQR